MASRAAASAQVPVGKLLIVWACLVGSCLVGAAIVVQPNVIALALAAPLLVGVVASARIRLAAVVIGGLVVLQSSQSLDYLKIFYLAVVVMSVAASLAGLLRQPRALSVGERWLMRSAFVWAFLVGVSIIASASGGVGPDAWLRDVAPYLLLATYPMVAIDAGPRVGRRYAQGLLVITGALAALSVAVTWIGIRGFTELPLDRLLLPSGALAAALFCLAAAHYFVGRNHRLRDVVAMGALLGLSLATGTRSSFLILLPLPAIAALSSRTFRIRQLFLLLAGGTFVVLLVVPLVTLAAGFDVAAVVTRFMTVGNLANDASLVERLTQNDATWRLFQASPIIGAGPGTIITWVNISGQVVSGWNSDAPTAFLSKYGIVGLMLLGTAIWCTFRAAMWPPRVWRATVSSLALTGLLVLLTTTQALGSVLDDKGYAFGLLLLFTAKLGSSVRGFDAESITASSSDDSLAMKAVDEGGEHIADSGPHDGKKLVIMYPRIRPVKSQMARRI